MNFLEMKSEQITDILYYDWPSGNLFCHLRLIGEQISSFAGKDVAKSQEPINSYFQNFNWNFDWIYFTF